MNSRSSPAFSHGCTPPFDATPLRFRSPGASGGDPTANRGFAPHDLRTITAPFIVSLLTAWCWLPHHAHAQASPAASAASAVKQPANTPAAPAPATPASGISDAVQRAAASPFKWILMNARPAAKPAKPPETAKDAVAKEASKDNKPTRDAPARDTAARASGGADGPRDLPPRDAAARAAALAAVQGLGAKPATSDAASASGAASASPPSGNAQTAANPVPASAAAATSGVAASPAGAGASLPSAAADARTAASSIAADANDAADVPLSPLIPVYQPDPRPSASAINRANKGVVRIEFTVTPQGNTTDVRVVSSSARPLNSAAVSAVSEWRFQPIAQAQTVQVEFGFNFE